MDLAGLKKRLAEELQSRSKNVKETSDGLEFHMQTRIGRGLNPGASSMAGLRRGEFTFREEKNSIVVHGRNIVLTGFFAIVTIIVLAQCYVYWWWNRGTLPVWTTAVPAGLLVLYFVYYAIATRAAMNSLWNGVLKNESQK